MIMTNKLLPVALVAALIGGSVGALVMYSNNATAETQKTTLDSSRNPGVQYAQYQADVSGREQSVPTGFSTSAEQTAYKTGFADGFKACESGAAGSQVTTRATTTSQPRVVYRNTGRTVARNTVARNTVARNTVARNTSSSRSVYYDYQEPKKRSFWSKHRDKLTVAMGAGGGAAIGGLVGGKKGAAIGALAGGGGSALYTYKLRNKNRRY